MTHSLFDQSIKSFECPKIGEFVFLFISPLSIDTKAIKILHDYLILYPMHTSIGSCGKNLERGIPYSTISMTSLGPPSKKPKDFDDLYEG